MIAFLVAKSLQFPPQVMDAIYGPLPWEAIDIFKQINMEITFTDTQMRMNCLYNAKQPILGISGRQDSSNQFLVFLLFQLKANGITVHFLFIRLLLVSRKDVIMDCIGYQVWIPVMGLTQMMIALSALSVLHHGPIMIKGTE